MANLTPVAVSEFINSGDQVLQLLASNFGNQGVAAAADAESLILSLPNNVSLSGVAISPDSDIDRCFVNYTVPTPVVEDPKSPTPPTFASDNYFLSVDRPLMQSIRGPIAFRAFSNQRWTDSFYPQGAAAQAPFGDALIPFVDPFFRLDLAFGNRGLPFAPTRRSPKHDTSVLGADAGVEAIQRVIPIFGRKKIWAQFRSRSDGASGAATFDVRVAAVYGDVTGAGNPGTSQLVERQIFPATFPNTATITDVGGQVADSGVIELAEGANFLVIYAERTGGLAVDGFFSQIVATD